MGQRRKRQRIGSTKRKAQKPGPKNKARKKKEQKKKPTRAPSRANWAREHGIILEEARFHKWWKFGRETLPKMLNWSTMSVDERKRQFETSHISRPYNVKDMRIIARRLLVLLVYHPSWWKPEIEKKYIQKRKGTFDSEKAADYLWDPSIPFKPVNSGRGRNRANLEELNLMVDYMIPRVATEVLPYLRFSQSKNMELANRLSFLHNVEQTFEVEQQEEMDVAFLEDEGPIIGEDVYFGVPPRATVIRTARRH